VRSAVRAASKLLAVCRLVCGRAEERQHGDTCVCKRACACVRARVFIGECVCVAAVLQVSAASKQCSHGLSCPNHKYALHVLRTLSMLV